MRSLLEITPGVVELKDGHLSFLALRNVSHQKILFKLEAVTKFLNHSATISSYLEPGASTTLKIPLDKASDSTKKFHGWVLVSWTFASKLVPQPSWDEIFESRIVYDKYVYFTESKVFVGDDNEFQEAETKPILNGADFDGDGGSDGNDHAQSGESDEDVSEVSGSGLDNFGSEKFSKYTCEDGGKDEKRECGVKAHRVDFGAWKWHDNSVGGEINAGSDEISESSVCDDVGVENSSTPYELLPDGIDDKDRDVDGDTMECSSTSSNSMDVGASISQCAGLRSICRHDFLVDCRWITSVLASAVIVFYLSILISALWASYRNQDSGCPRK